MAWAASMANSFSAAGFQVTTVPSGVHAMIASRALRTIIARSCAAPSGICTGSDDTPGDGTGDGKFDAPSTNSSGLGAAFSKDGTTARFRVASHAATRIEV